MMVQSKPLQPQQQAIVLDRVDLSTPLYQNLSNVSSSHLRISGPPMQMHSEPMHLRSSIPINMTLNPLIAHNSIISSTNITSEAVNWSLMVDAFVKKTSGNF